MQGHYAEHPSTFLHKHSKKPVLPARKWLIKGLKTVDLAFKWLTVSSTCAVHHPHCHQPQTFTCFSRLFIFMAADAFGSPGLGWYSNCSHPGWKTVMTSGRMLRCAASMTLYATFKWHMPSGMQALSRQLQISVTGAVRDASQWSDK